MARRPSGITLVALGLGLLCAGAWPAGQANSSLARNRVRPESDVAKRLLAEGVQRSYTIARLIDTLEQGDVVVYVDVAPPPGSLPTSQTRLVASGANGWRYLSVCIDRGLQPLRRLEMLGHELQHAAEIADARDVVDTDGLQRLYARIGHYSWDDHTFETKRAILAEMQVGQEVLASLEPTDAPPDTPSAAGDSEDDQRRLYDGYCAVCHGRNGRGRGPGQYALAITAPDLTLLARRNGGTFPRSTVERCIRASSRPAADAAASGMPVWTPLPPGHDPGAAAYAESIAAYVESLQRR